MSTRFPTSTGFASRSLVIGFTAAVFGSAFLLFSVQPMVSRLVLPRLGGSPSVWNTCVLFFQAALLLGYLYADLSATRLRLRGQVILHGAVLMAGLALLPLSIGEGAPDAATSPPLWLLGRLTLSIGVPFFVISATAPMLQNWFARTSHRQAHDPYFLYAASNTGSLLALLAYPVVIETTLGLTAQRMLWSTGFALVAVGVLACGLLAMTNPAPVLAHEPGETVPQAPLAPLTKRIQLRWVGLAFLPSGLMLALTTHIASDVASAPLFWVVPLAIYIATFMLAFGRRQRVTPSWLPPVQAITLLGAAAMTLLGAPDLALLGVSLSVSLVAFAATAALCHLELARERPDVRQLTRYFFLISVGGALGGIFNGLIAPVLFNGPWEYPILLLAAAIFRPVKPVARAPALPRPKRFPGWVRPLALLVGGLGLLWSGSALAPDSIRPIGAVLRIVLPAAAMIWAFWGGANLGIGMAGLLVLPLLVKAHNADLIARSFFGTYRVMEIPDDGLTVLEHGTTMHGMQSTRPGDAAEPLAYYYRTGPFGRLMAVMDRRMPPDATIGVLGLGAGALGCYARPAETWIFREIDPEVERLARDDRYFHFMKLCGNHPQVILGDARITLAAEPAARYDLIILDVFSSDSVPMHLLTQDALKLYFGHLKPGGVVAFHVSNRYLELAPVVARLAVSLGAPVRHLGLDAPESDKRRKLGTELVVVAPPGGSLDAFAADGWDVPKAGHVLWTDEKSDIYSVIRWR
jgi:hypothetical protein